MNLFFIGWKLPSNRQEIAVSALRGMVEVYPQLAANSLWQATSPCGTLMIASLRTDDQVAAPRQYLDIQPSDRDNSSTDALHSQNAKQLTMYCGLPVHPTGEFPAHQAPALSGHWDQLANVLEGQYALVRAEFDPPRLELLNDFLGMEQVYYARRGEQWLISNSVQLIERIAGPRPLDLMGASLMISLGWVAADRTLRQGIRVFPAGQRWIWEKGQAEPQRRSTMAARLGAGSPLGEGGDLLPGSHKKASADDETWMELARSLTALCAALGSQFPGQENVIECPVTAGRDSRLLVALARRAGLHPQYYTGGEPSSADVQIGVKIAQLYDLPHQVHAVTAGDVAQRWEGLAQRYVRRYDGMSSLWQLGDVLTMPEHVDRLVVTLWGIGGEIARGFYYRPLLFLSGRHDLPAVSAFLVRRLIQPHGGLLTQEALELTKAFIEGFVRNQVAAGYAPIDAPDLFYAYQRVGRWAGNNARKTAPVCDHFSPFCSRPWVQATLALPALQRYTEPLHFNLLRLLAPELIDLPFDKGSWHHQDPLLNLLQMSIQTGRQEVRNALRQGVPQSWRRTISGRLRKRQPPPKPRRAMEQANWLEIKREHVRSVCLDQPDTDLWNLVDRTALEHMLSDRIPAIERMPFTSALYGIATLCYYTTDHRTNLA